MTKLSPPIKQALLDLAASEVYPAVKFLLAELVNGAGEAVLKYDGQATEQSAMGLVALQAKYSGAKKLALDFQIVVDNLHKQTEV